MDLIVSCFHVLKRSLGHLRRSEFLFASVGVLFPILLPAVQFGIFHRWWTTKLKVTRETCSCTCWDMIFKGSYEEYGTSYKNIYFNVTTSTLLIWTSTVIAVIVLYECVRYLLRLCAENRLRVSAAILIVSSIYPHYYTWWMYFNMRNDDYFEQFYHQALFSITEIVSSFLLVPLCDADVAPTPLRSLAIITIAVFHVVAACRDQFFDNVVMGVGEPHQLSRDVGFMVVDALLVAVPWSWLRTLARGSAGGWGDVVTRDELALCCTFVVLLTLLSMAI